jgi:tetratricopeptide (TPR) repeat protein
LITKLNVYDTLARAAVGYRFGLQSEEDYERWFRMRMNVFLETTLQSVQAMNPPPEIWMLLVDEAMPAFTEELQRKVSHIPFVAVCTIPRPATPRTSSYYSTAPLSKHIAERLRSDAQYVMTVLLDDDDCLHREYLRHATFYAGLLEPEELQSAQIINFPNGLRWTRDYVYPMTLYSNPYLAFVEPREWYRNAPDRHLTAYQRIHGDLNQSGILHDIPLEAPMWLRQYHERNWLKPEFGAGPQHPLGAIKPLLATFGLEHLAPSEPSYSYVLGAKHLAAGGGVDDALALLDKARQSAPDWAVLAYEEARLWMEKRDFPRVLDACNRWTALSGDHPFSTYQAGLMCLQAGEASLGRSFLEKAFLKQPGLACERVELTPRSSELLRTHHTDWGWTWYQEGLALAHQEKPEEALRAFSSAMERSPSWSEPYAAAAQTAFAAKMDAAVHVLAEKGLALRPFWPELLHLTGRSFMREERWAEAAEALFKSTEQQLDVTDPNYDLALTLVRLGRIEEAEVSIGDALLCNGEHAKRLQEFHDLLLSLGHTSKAEVWKAIADLCA